MSEEFTETAYKILVTCMTVLQAKIVTPVRR
jgi:hypothetical protein